MYDIIVTAFRVTNDIIIKSKIACMHHIMIFIKYLLIRNSYMPTMANLWLFSTSLWLHTMKIKSYLNLSHFDFHRFWLSDGFFNNIFNIKNKNILRLELPG